MLYKQKKKKKENKNRKTKNEQTKTHTKPLSLISYININTTWITDLNVNYKMIQLLGTKRTISLGSRTMHRVCRLDIKSIIHKEKWINLVFIKI